MAETFDDHELMLAGWARADLDWENHTESFVTLLTQGDAAAARADAGRALFLAREAFAGDDPRLGTALANHAAALVAAGGNSAADLQEEARDVWGRCDEWIAAMRAPRMARSSLFHMRMEQKHRAEYEERWRVKWAALREEAVRRIGSPLMAPDASTARARLDRWRRERPAMLNDTRKLMAAAILLVAGAE